MLNCWIVIHVRYRHDLVCKYDTLCSLIYVYKRLLMLKEYNQYTLRQPSVKRECNFVLHNVEHEMKAGCSIVSMRKCSSMSGLLFVNID